MAIGVDHVLVAAVVAAPEVVPHEVVHREGRHAAVAQVRRVHLQSNRQRSTIQSNLFSQTDLALLLFLLWLYCERFAKGIDLFMRAEWKMASDEFKSILKSFPHDGPCRFYFSQCQQRIKAKSLPDNPFVINMEQK